MIELELYTELKLIEMLWAWCWKWMWSAAIFLEKWERSRVVRDFSAYLPLRVAHRSIFWQFLDGTRLNLDFRQSNRYVWSAFIHILLTLWSDEVTSILMGMRQLLFNQIDVPSIHLIANVLELHELKRTWIFAVEEESGMVYEVK